MARPTVVAFWPSRMLRRGGVSRRSERIIFRLSPCAEKAASGFATALSEKALLAAAPKRAERHYGADAQLGGFFEGELEGVESNDRKKQRRLQSRLRSEERRV